jgi:hypothetical protein
VGRDDVGSDPLNWEALSAIAEAVGAFGTVIALVYLARQIRQNTAGTRLAARQALTHESTEFTRLLLDSQIGPLFARTNQPDLAAFANPLGLSREELLLFRNVQYIAFANLENSFRAWQAGTLSDDEWSAPNALLRNIYLSSAASRDYWSAMGRQVHGAAFVAFVDEYLRGVDTE